MVSLDKDPGCFTTYVKEVMSKSLPPLRIRLFGQLELDWDDTPLLLPRSPAARSLLAFLIIHAGRSFSRDFLAGTFWFDRPDPRARRALSQALWHIRHTLRPLDRPGTAQAQDTAADRLVTEREAVTFHLLPGDWLDVKEFQEKVHRCTDNQAPVPLSTCLLELSEAIALYRGDFLEECYDDWALLERERLRELYLDALETLVAAHKQRGEYEEALTNARRLVAADPLRESAHQELMRLYHLLGRDRAALEQYKTLSRILADEMGVEPMAATVTLAQEIAARLEEADLPYLPVKVRPAPVFERPELMPLVGREKERATLLAHLEAAIGGQGGLVLIEGEAGVGKTRLLQEIARDAEWRGAQVYWGRGREPAELPPYGVLREALQAALSPLRAGQLAELVEGVWLREVSRMLPELAEWLPELPPYVALEPEQQQARLLEALTRTVLALGHIVPHLLILEDLQWADEATLSALIHLLRRLAESRVLVIASYRGEEAREQPALWEALQSLDRAGGHQRLLLARLTAAQTGELVRRGLGLAARAPLLEERLYRETDGNPLFVLETLRALHDEGLLYRNENGDWSTPWDETTTKHTELPLPAGVGQMIARRLARLGDNERATLNVAAVLGSDFDFALLAQAVNLEREVALAAVSELLRRRFLVEEPAVYRFSHDKVRQIAYMGIEETERQRLHRQAGLALEALHPEQIEQLAHHFSLGQVWDKAVDYHKQAGDRAQEVYANARAAAHYTQALEALEQLPGPLDPTRSFELRLAREAVYALQGERAAQAEDLRALEALAATLDDGGQLAAKRRAKVALRQAHYAEAIGDYSAAIATAQIAIELARAGQDATSETMSYLQWGIALWRQGNYEAALPQLEQALALARTACLRQMEAESSRNLGIVLYYQGDYTGARPYSEQALRIFREIGDRQGESWSLNNLGNLSLYQGDYTGARTYYEQSLRIKREIGDRMGEGYLLINLGIVFLEQGDYATARDHLEQSLQICRLIGDRRGESNALINLGLVAWSQGDYARARAYLEPSLRICCEIGDRQSESWALAYLGLLSHRLGDNETAREYSEQVLLIARELGNRSVQGYALTNLGHALVGLGRLMEAADAYRQALDIRRELGQHNLAMEPLAGLARVSLAQGDLSQAQDYVKEILNYLKTNTLDGTEETFQIYLTCYRALRAVHDPRAQETLIGAYNLLQERAAKITDAKLRRSFLENVPAHRELVSIYHDLQARQYGSQIIVSLPRAGAPTGRPLRDDEWVQVAWTVAAPEDEAVAGKVARRHHRLLRLLREAAEQGAAPTVPDLAAALGVGVRTIKRDLATLRAAGHEVTTRGSRSPTNMP